MKFAIIVDNPKRDLDGVTLVAHELVKRGAEVLLVPMYQQGYDVPLLCPHGVIVNYARPNNAELLASYRALDMCVMVLDTEGGVLSQSGPDSPENWARLFRENGYDRLVDGYFFWGSRLYSAFHAQSALPSCALHITGCPRFDFCAEPWRRLFAGPQNGYVLVNTNFSSINPRFTESADREKAILLELGWQPEYASRLFEHLHAVWPRYLDTIEHIARRLPQCRVWVRPHPFEEEAPYARRLAGLENVTVDGRGNVLPTIANAACVVHLNCGTAVEATMLGTPAISLEYLNTEVLRSHAWLPARLSIAASSLRELEDLLQDPAELRRRTAAQRDGNLREWIEPWFHRVDGQAAARVADAAVSVITAAPTPRRSVAHSARGSRARTAPRMLAGVSALVLGSRLADRLQAVARPARRAKRFTVHDVRTRLAQIAPLDKSASGVVVEAARSPVTGLPLSSIRVAAK